MLNFYLTEDEFEALAGKYRSSDNMFSYNDFCSTINLAFTTKGIDKDPTATVKPVTSEDTYVARRKYLDIVPEEQQAVADILQEYKKAIANRRIHLKPQFQDFDITRNGHVSKM